MIKNIAIATGITTVSYFVLSNLIMKYAEGLDFVLEYPHTFRFYYERTDPSFTGWKTFSHDICNPSLSAAEFEFYTWLSALRQANPKLGYQYTGEFMIVGTCTQ